jgi:hypothetical protein
MKKFIVLAIAIVALILQEKEDKGTEKVKKEVAAADDFQQLKWENYLKEIV